LKMRIASLSLLALCLTLAAVPAMAQTDLYDNGPVNGQDLGWTINFGFSVSDTFTLGSAATVTGASMWLWLIPGDTVNTVEVQIGAAAFGNELMDQTLAVSATNCFGNQFGYNVCDETATFNNGGVALGAGTYWMTLSNATDTEGQGVYWDLNNGPSQAQENTIGTVPSESFTMWGAGSTSTSTSSTGTGTTPEPSSIMLFGSGILGLAGILRRKLF
jgi:PEP-CTERM motif